MKQYNALFGIAAGVAVAFSSAGAYALDTGATAHEQAVQIAKDTDGVKSVVSKLSIGSGAN